MCSSDFHSLTSFWKSNSKTESGLNYSSEVHVHVCLFVLMSICEYRLWGSSEVNIWPKRTTVTPCNTFITAVLKCCNRGALVIAVTGNISNKCIQNIKYYFIICIFSIWTLRWSVFFYFLQHFSVKLSASLHQDRKSVV